MSIELIGGDCREVLAGRPEASLDAIVCDPPYELNFLGVEANADYLEIARARIAYYAGQPRQAALDLEGLL